MKTLIKFFLLMFTSLSLNLLSDEPLDHRLAELSKSIEAGKEEERKIFFDYVRKSGTPLVEAIANEEGSKRVTFLWFGDEKTKFVSVMTEIDPINSAMKRLPKTNVWYKTVKVPKDVRTTYAFFINGSSEAKKDPYNLHTFIYPEGVYSNRGKTIFSVLELPDAKSQKWVDIKLGTPRGSLFKYKYTSRILRNERDLWVYYPNGHPHRGESYPLVIIFDGEAYTSLVPGPAILDNLIAEKAIPPVVAVFVGSIDQKTRSSELPCNPSFLKFLTDELIPWMHTKHYATSDHRKIIAAGSSYGGLAAMYAAMNRPDAISNALSQSGAFYWLPPFRTGIPPIMLKAKNETDFPIKVYMDAGLLETEHDQRNLSILSVNRQMKELLHGKVQHLTYSEFSGGHEYIWWQNTLADGLIDLLGDRNPR